MRMTTHLNLSPRLKMSGTTLPSSYTSSWYIKELPFALVIIYQHYFNYGKYTVSNDIRLLIVSMAGSGRRHSRHI
jgi:hypothetical protein